MIHAKHTLLLASCGLPLLFSFGSRADRVAFQVAKDLELTKTFSNQTNLTLDDMRMSMNGNEMDPSMMGNMEMTIDSSESFTITDTYAELASGRPKRLVRSFDALGSKTTVTSSNQMMGDSEQDLKGSSELEGKSVVFSWDEAEGQFVAAFAEDSQGDDELLEGLEEDMDLRCLLPEGEVSLDEGWDLDLGLLVHLMAPGGNLKIKPEDLGESGGMMGDGTQPSLAEMIGDLEGKATGTYKGKRDVDGVNVAVIALSIDVASAKDMTDFFTGAVDAAEMPDEMEMSFESVDMSFKITAEGELLWDLAGGHFHNLELSGDMEMDMDMEISMSMQGQDMSLSQSMQMSGSFSQKAVVGAAR